MSEPSPTGEWLVFRGAGERHDGIDRLPAPPPWRDFRDRDRDAETRRLGVHRSRAAAWRPGAEELEVVNAALYLRRPLLVTGAPGVGKSTLAHAVADELGLGAVLRWPVVSRTTLQDGLYRYDAIARLQDVQIAAHAPGGVGQGDPGSVESIGDYIRLGPLGTALLPSRKPRVLLVDELDKSDIDLPNDLLNVLEEGEFAIPELERVAHRLPDGVARVRAADGTTVEVRDGKVRCTEFPFVVLTSNQERDFPAALMRRCLHLELGRPDRERLAAFVRAHLGEDRAEAAADLVQRFMERSRTEMLAADQLLNAIHLTGQAPGMDRERLADLLVQRLDRPR
ncbi:MoxR family ATPase [Streptomyces sp. NPDC005012]|uniref:AAA family ATPase n=1 Tax=unclassified Streptomyces TaxID=2593676 RepID=UPI0033BA3819